MKKGIKIIIGIILTIFILILIDLASIFTLNRPIFAIHAKTPYMYTGIFYNTYTCPEYSVAQIKSKGTKFTCAVETIGLEKVEKIIDKTTEIKDFSCAEALEQFYEDEEYTYYYNCLKSKYIIVRYKNGYEETVQNALKYGSIKITDLDLYNIEYLKYKK